MVGVPTFPYGPTSFDGGGVAAAGVSAAYRVDLSKKIPQLGEDNYLDWLFSISTCFAAMGLSKLLTAGYRGATSGVSESSGVHGRAAGYRGAPSGVSESSGCHGRESRRALGETGVSGSRVANLFFSSFCWNSYTGGRVANALCNVFQTPKRASGSQEQKQQSSELSAIRAAFG